MRTARLKHKTAATYHVMSRTIEGRFIIVNDPKNYRWSATAKLWRTFESRGEICASCLSTIRYQRAKFYLNIEKYSTCKEKHRLIP